MAENELRAGRWGPVTDPAPWGTGGGWCSPRWPWGPDPIDPAPLREKLVAVIKAEDVAALQHARLEARAAQLRAQVQLLEKEMKILAKYGQGG